VEGGFMDSTTDKLILTVDGQKKYAQAVCDGLVSFCGLQKKGETTPPAGDKFKVGDTVIVNGYPCINANGDKPGAKLTNYTGKVTIVNPTGANRYHVDQKGWCRESELTAVGSAPTPPAPSTPDFVVGGRVKIKQSAQMYSRSTVAIPGRYKGIAYTIQQAGGDDVLIKELYSWVKKSDVESV